MNILPHHVAAILLVSGLIVGGYYGINSLISPTLDSHLNFLNLTLSSDGWTEKAKEYKKETNNNLIASIDKTKEDNNVGEALKNWCEKKKDKYFLGNEDITYKNFSLWCTVNKKIKDVLNGRLLKSLDTNGWTQKLSSYNKETNQDKFIKAAKDNNATQEQLKNWCEDTKSKTDYTYEGDFVLSRILNWCYG